MKYLKMIGLAAVSAMALMAFMGASTASADELCTTTAVNNMCPEGKLITEIHGTLKKGTSAKLTDTEGFTLDTCTAGTVKIKNTSQGTGVNPITGSVEALTWGEAGTSCAFTTDTLANGSTSATQATGGGTTVTSKGSQVTINTGLFGSCVYGTGEGTDLGSTANGGNELVINATVNKISGGFACPTTAKWSATYTITNHNAVFYIQN